jgi:integrase
MRKALTAREVATITEPGRYADGGNLYLKVDRTAAGYLSRHWSFLYTVPGGGRKREMGLGPAYDVGLKEARDRAESYRALLRRGVDPLEESKAAEVAARPSKTLRQCMVEFVEAKQRDWKPGRSPAYGYAAAFPREFARLGKLNDMPIGDIDTSTLLAAFRPLWTQYKSAHALLAKLERILDFAKVQGLRNGDNPARWKGHFSELLSRRPEAVNYAAMGYSDVPGLIVRLRDESLCCQDNADRYRKKVEGSVAKRHTSVAAQAVEFLILTAVRQQEALAATWDEFDIDEALWSIPAARTKSARLHVIPLSRQAVALLRKREELRTSSPYVFPPTRNARGPIAGGTPLAVLRNLGIPPEEATVHGFRSSFKDWACNETDFADETSEEVLGHVVGDQTRRAYRRDSGIEKRRALLQSWADYVAPNG